MFITPVDIFAFYFFGFIVAFVFVFICYIILKR